ncbi:MAG: hypothetical protein ACTSW7_01765 [Candidatus Thorarchaeota archaeon]
MKSSRSELMRRILLTIDQHPSSIYDIQYSMTNFSDPKRTRLPKLLKSMENDNLVVSALQPGPLGPYRRIYKPGPEAEKFLVEILGNAIETILHFYNVYRTSNPGELYDLGQNPELATKDGNILYASYPQVKVNDLNEIRDLSSNRDVTISILGPDDILSKTGISYDVVGANIMDIESPSKTYSEVRLRGVPPKDQLPKSIEECKRVIVRGGILRMIAPFVFFDEPENANLGEFIRVTAATQFPELGVVEGSDILHIISQNFSKYGSYETKLAQVHFWAIKS